MSVKNLLTREGYWGCVKEVIAWIIDTEEGTFAPPDRKLQELRDLLYILTTQKSMGRKDLKRLVGKLHSMHLAVPGEVPHLYHIQRALAQARANKSFLSPDLHCKIADWRILAEQTADQPTHLA